ncbi:MAG: TRL-like family protein [Lentisphaeria bacterium]
MKKLLVLGGMAAGLLASGCVMPNGPVFAGIVLDQKGAVAGVDNSVSTENMKQGVATAKGIVLFSTGDASIKTAMQNGNIKKVHHVDSEQFNVLGIYSEYKTIVYGQ